MSLEDIGNAIRSARKGQQRSQAEVAGKIGMSRATLSAIENGTVVEIGIRKVIAVCGELGLDVVAISARRPTLQELKEERRAARSGG